ncbi:MAG TPA: hypothetical protein VFZ16_09195 [Hyphomicrobiaceae bacterium]|nr:hypothetical protein [Hyphomicrobiaceae bacterium]
MRGNAILGFGHIARRLRRLDRRIVQPIIHAGLDDDEAFVRGQADAAMDDTMHFLEWDEYKTSRIPGSSVGRTGNVSPVETYRADPLLPS